MSDSCHHNSAGVQPQPPFVADAPLNCSTCDAALCLRKQVINLALGNVETMYCLTCLGKENEQRPEEILAGLMAYVQDRDCFKKEWQRYLSVDYCPDQANCFPSICFATAQRP